jgi:ornithine--oxo-acid transaminase
VRPAHHPRPDVLLLADEIQSGLGRTGTTFACELEDVVPDVYILGKALGGGVIPVSAIAAGHELMSVFTPGSHGSTFGGNPLACAVGSAVMALLETGEFQARSRELGAHLAATGWTTSSSATSGSSRPASSACGPACSWSPACPPAGCASGCSTSGVLAKDTHETTVRLAPPLVITRDEVDLLVDRLEQALG